MSLQGGEGDLSHVPAPSAGHDELLEHLQAVEQRARERAERETLVHENEQLIARLSSPDARSGHAATVRFIVLCVLMSAGLLVLLYIQIDSRGSGQLRRQLVVQCEVRNANSIALQAQLRAASIDTDDVDLSRDLAAAADTLTTYPCAQLR